MKKYTLLMLAIMATSAQAELIEGIEFPDGNKSFADAVVSYAPGAGVKSPYNQATLALSRPDNVEGGAPEFVSLGNQGQLVLRFSDNALTTSGNSNHDLWVFEIGAEIEATDVYISQDGYSWIYVGSTAGGTRGIDIDAYVGQGVTLGARYSFVKLVDLLPNQSGSPYAGADIDAVGAISSTQPVCGLPSEMIAASYEPSTGRLKIPFLMADGQCYEMELEGSGGLPIDGQTLFYKTSLTPH
jgi:hypothetical protein